MINQFYLTRLIGGLGPRLAALIWQISFPNQGGSGGVLGALMFYFSFSNLKIYKKKLASLIHFFSFFNLRIGTFFAPISWHDICILKFVQKKERGLRPAVCFLI